MRYQEIFEATDYNAMFNPVRKHLEVSGATPEEQAEAKAQFDGWLKAARKILKRGNNVAEDAMIFYLRYVQAHLTNPKQYRNTPEAILDFMGHIMGMTHVPAIAKFRYPSTPNIDFTEVLRKLDQAEKDWQKSAEESKRVAQMEATDTILMSFPDGFSWVNLNKSKCSIEGKAMGHCGNSAGRDSDTVLSLRKKVKGKNGMNWEPRATFILHDDGFLGEMKGRFNQKPEEQYHPHIVALLKSGLVKGITGGGYDSAKNFSLVDLPVEQAIELTSSLEITAEGFMDMLLSAKDTSHDELLTTIYDDHEFYDESIQIDGEHFQISDSSVAGGVSEGDEIAIYLGDFDAVRYCIDLNIDNYTNLYRHFLEGGTIEVKHDACIRGNLHIGIENLEDLSHDYEEDMSDEDVEELIERAEFAAVADSFLDGICFRYKNVNSHQFPNLDVVDQAALDAIIEGEEEEEEE